MNNTYDVIVVGAGNGGLVSAGLTAKAGLKTLLLEKNNLPGGCATSFRRGRFEFEPSLHEMAGVGTEEDPGSVDRIFKEVGANIDWLRDTNMFRTIVKGENGFDATLKADLEGFCRSLDKEVPGTYEASMEIFKLLALCDEALEYVDRKNGNPGKLKMVLKYGDFMRFASHSVSDILDALGFNEKAKCLISTYWSYLGVPTDELNAMNFFTMLREYAKHGPALPKNRSHELSLALADAFIKNGGEVRYNSEVSEFLFDESGRCTGVGVGSEKLYAREVISNIIPNSVYAKSGNKNIPVRDRQVANARELAISLFAVYLGLDCTAEELGIKDYTVFVMNGTDSRKQFEDRDNCGIYIVNCLNCVVPGCTPEGTCTISFSIPAEGTDLPEDLSPENYKKYKNQIADKYIRDYEKLTGLDIRSHIEEISIATPVTFARYLDTPSGTIYGYRLSDWDNIITRVTCQEKEFTVPGLSFVGGHSYMGDGYISAYITGESVGKKIVARLKGKEV